MTVDGDGKHKCRLGVGFLQIEKSYTDEVHSRFHYTPLPYFTLQVDMLLLKKLWREMIERRCLKSRILTVSEYKRVDEEEGDGGKLEVEHFRFCLQFCFVVQVEWWKPPKPKKEVLELMKLKKVWLFETFQYLSVTLCR